MKNNKKEILLHNKPRPEKMRAEISHLTKNEKNKKKEKKWIKMNIMGI